MAEIEREILAEGGIHPEGRVTIQMLLKKAGLGASYLEKKTPRIVSLKRTVLSWIKKLERVAPGDTRAIQNFVTSKVHIAKEELRAARQVYLEAELEHAQRAADLQAALDRVRDLEAENERLLKLLIESKLRVDLTPSRARSKSRVCN